jgi:tryptophan synthase beta subunit
MGLFHEFVDDEDVRLIGVEAAGFGIGTNKHAATLTMGQVGVLHGAMSYLLQDDDGQIIEPHSISAGYGPYTFRFQTINAPRIEFTKVVTVDQMLSFLL